MGKYASLDTQALKDLGFGERHGVTTGEVVRKDVYKYSGLPPPTTGRMTVGWARDRDYVRFYRNFLASQGAAP